MQDLGLPCFLLQASPAPWNPLQEDGDPAGPGDAQVERSPHHRGICCWVPTTLTPHWRGDKILTQLRKPSLTPHQPNNNKYKNIKAELTLYQQHQPKATPNNHPLLQSLTPAAQKNPTNTCKLVHVPEREGVDELLVVLLDQAGCRDVLPDQGGGGLCVAIGIDVHAAKNTAGAGGSSLTAPAQHQTFSWTIPGGIKGSSGGIS